MARAKVLLQIADGVRERGAFRKLVRIGPAPGTRAVANQNQHRWKGNKNVLGNLE